MVNTFDKAERLLQFAIATNREVCIRTNQFEPKTYYERKLAREGCVEISELDIMRDYNV